MQKEIKEEEQAKKDAQECLKKHPVNIAKTHECIENKKKERLGGGAFGEVFNQAAFQAANQAAIQAADQNKKETQSECPKCPEPEACPKCPAPKPCPVCPECKVCKSTTGYIVGIVILIIISIVLGVLYWRK